VAGRVVLVACSPRVPPGLLSWPAWEALRAGPVSTADADCPQLPYLRDAGIVVCVEAADPVVLLARADAGQTVVWLAPDADLVRALGRSAVAGGAPVELVHGSYDPPGARLLDVVAVMDRLRSPGGCPWDADQTHDSLRPYLLEEVYEAYQALEDGNLVDLREELGDVLLQVVFHARLGQEGKQPWSIDDVAGDLVDKLVRRHPHVFAGGTADDLEGSWEALKAAEKGRASVTDGVPLSQPALALAAKLQKRAARLGAPVPAYGGLGGQLWDVVARCRQEGVDPEAALRATARAFLDRLAAVEAELSAEGTDARGLTPEQWSTRWR
jgi:XTP/dITP diphosphohydrolase